MENTALHILSFSVPMPIITVETFNLRELKQTAKYDKIQLYVFYRSQTTKKNMLAVNAMTPCIGC